MEDSLLSSVVSLSTGSAGAVVSSRRDPPNYLVVVSRTLDAPTDLNVEFG